MLSTSDPRPALSELHQYLMDRIPPLTASDSVEALLEHPPELMVREIHAWVAIQSRVDPTVPLSDFLFHAFKKVHAMSELKLIPRPRLKGHLEQMIPLAMRHCPEDERELLGSNLKFLLESESVQWSDVRIHRQTSDVSSRGGRGAALTDEAARSLKRFSLIVERLEKSRTAGAPEAGNRRQERGRLITIAANQAESKEEFDDYMRRISPDGAGDARDVFNALGDSIPSWDVPLPPGKAETAPMKAMKKIASFAENPMEGAQRLREMLAAANDQINAGSLSAAVSMMELAETIIVERKLDPRVVERIRTAFVEGLDLEHVKKLAENRGRHGMLRKLFAFFPTLEVENLLDELRIEERRDRRRTLLTLLEVHGVGARNAAFGRLEALSATSDSMVTEAFFIRNLLFLMHRIPADEQRSLDRELDGLAAVSGRGQPIQVLREAVSAIGQVKSEKGARLLVTRLADFEALLLRNDATYLPQDLHSLLERIVIALSRLGHPRALRAIAIHGVKVDPLLGDTRSRVTCLAAHDLSADAETVNILSRAIREELPGKMFGRVIGRRQPGTGKLIEALAGTRSDAVDALLSEIEGKYNDHELGRLAGDILRNPRPVSGSLPDPKPASEFETVTPEAGESSSLIGDLQFFGLPTLLQGLGDTRASGQLTLTDQQGTLLGILWLTEGLITGAECGRLRGVDGVYQLLERPATGSFAFSRRAEPPADRRLARPMEIMAALLEGLRRSDELAQAALLVPDDATVAPTTSKPTPFAAEVDPALLRSVWLKALSRRPLSEWEGEIEADSFRIRRLLAHWVEESSLQIL